MGCGTGANFPFYSKRVSEVTAVDWSPNMLMQAFGKLSEFQQKGEVEAKISFMQADCSALDFEDESFDCVVDTFTLSSAFDKTANCKEMVRLCKPGGHILLLERGCSYLSPYN